VFTESLSRGSPGGPGTPARPRLTMLFEAFWT
jgi:hypothetical protein